MMLAVVTRFAAPHLCLLVKNAPFGIRLRKLPAGRADALCGIAKAAGECLRRAIEPENVYLIERASQRAIATCVERTMRYC